MTNAMDIYPHQSSPRLCPVAIFHTLTQRRLVMFGEKPRRRLSRAQEHGVGALTSMRFTGGFQRVLGALGAVEWERVGLKNLVWRLTGCLARAHERHEHRTTLDCTCLQLCQRFLETAFVAGYDRDVGALFG